MPKGLHKPVYRTIIVQICLLKSGACGTKIHSKKAVLGITSFQRRKYHLRLVFKIHNKSKIGALPICAGENSPIRSAPHLAGGLPNTER